MNSCTSSVMYWYNRDNGWPRHIIAACSVITAIMPIQGRNKTSCALEPLYKLYNLQFTAIKLSLTPMLAK